MQFVFLRLVGELRGGGGDFLRCRFAESPAGAFVGRLKEFLLHVFVLRTQPFECGAGVLLAPAHERVSGVVPRFVAGRFGEGILQRLLRIPRHESLENLLLGLSALFRVFYFGELGHGGIGIGEGECAERVHHGFLARVGIVDGRAQLRDEVRVRTTETERCHREILLLGLVILAFPKPRERPFSVAGQPFVHRCKHRDVAQFTFGFHRAFHGPGGIEFCEPGVGREEVDAGNGRADSAGFLQLSNELLQFLAVHVHDASGTFEKAAHAVSCGAQRQIELRLLRFCAGLRFPAASQRRIAAGSFSNNRRFRRPGEFLDLPGFPEINSRRSHDGRSKGEGEWQPLFHVCR